MKNSNPIHQSPGHKVIIMGGNHHNGLGLVRSFGIHGLKAYGIIIGEGAGKSFIRKSKYWEKTWAAKDEKEGIEILIREFGRETARPVVIPYSDGIARELDISLYKLEKRFLLPSFGGEQGKIAEFMDKYQQSVFLRQCGLSTLPGRIVEKGKPEGETIEFPVILKPVASVEGEKLDIRICRSKEEYGRELEGFFEKGYGRVLVQRYLENRTEYVLAGAVTDRLVTFTVVRNIRQWPIHIGCGSFSEFVCDGAVLDYGRGILEKLSDAGYRGLIDVEFFSGGDGSFYVNEVNWRSSGRNFVSLYTGVHSALQYYLSVTGKPVEGKRVSEKEGYTMVETSDIRHLAGGSASRLQSGCAISKGQAASRSGMGRISGRRLQPGGITAGD